ncbi:uncharacterized protein LOC119391158 [Rhipicephalus sanguineus]|uniref:uncharacterized protein LOC119391158 n=1 Tax=Rhipicephalus sanguineus TaxID=34632 RepID=UPI0018943A97|nr:uncharacterized protein LOC119391158 [Rhipicephalus sanguineus]
MYWPSQPKTPKKREENGEDIGRREPRFYVQKSSTTSSTRSQPRAPARIPLPLQRIPVVNKALAKRHARKSSARGTSVPNAAPETPPAQDIRSDADDNFLLQPDCKPNNCVHEKGKPCPNEMCLLARHEEKKTSSMSQVFTLTRPSSLISKLKDAVKAPTSSADSKNKSGAKGKSSSQSSDKAVDKSSKKPPDGATARIPEKTLATSPTRASDNASGAGSPSKTPPKPSDSAKSKKSTGSGARRCSVNSAAKAAAVLPPKKGAAPVVHKAAKKTAIAAGKITANRTINIAAPKKKTTGMPPVRIRAKIAQQGTIPRTDGGKRRTSDPKGSGKVVDKVGAKQTQTDSEKAGANVSDRLQRDDKTSTDKTSDRGSEKSSDGKSPLLPKDAPDKNQSSGGKISNVGDGCVQNAATATKSGSMATGTSTSSSRGITKTIDWPDITTIARALLVSVLVVAVVVVLLSLIFPEAFEKIVTLILGTDASGILPRRPHGHLLDAPYLSVTLKTSERTVAPEPRDRISGGGHETID